MLAASLAPEVPQTMLSLRDVFAILFVMLGPPIKTPIVYASATTMLSEREARKLAFKVFALASVAVLAGGYVGVAMMRGWHVSQAAMLIAAGLIFLLVSLRNVLDQYQPTAPASPTVPPKAFRLAVPDLATPYGLAAVVLLIAAANDASRTLGVLLIAVVVMLLNLLAMLFARQIMRAVGPIPLQLFGVIAGVLMIGLSIQILLAALGLLGVIGSP